MINAALAWLVKEQAGGLEASQEFAARIQVHIDSLMAQVRDLETLKVWVEEEGKSRAANFTVIIGEQATTAAVPAPAPVEVGA